MRECGRIPYSCSRAPSKPRISSVSSCAIQPRVLFPVAEDTPSVGVHSHSTGDDTPSDCADPRPTGANTLSPVLSLADRSSADILSPCDKLDSTVFDSPSLDQSSFVDEILPLGLTGNDILLHSSAIIGSATSVVREMFSTGDQRAPVLSSVVPPSASTSDPIRPSMPASEPPRSSALRPSVSSSAPPSLADPRNPTVDEPPPTTE